MKLQLLCISIFISFSSLAAAQSTGVEKSTAGIQTGLLGIWGHYETQVSNKVALRTEVGFDAGLFGGSYYDHTGFVLTPVITAEPRWYYNIAKRGRKGKNIVNNSANFFSLKINYHHDWFTISNYDNTRIAEQISFIPEWGIKRTVGHHFTYELGIGIGYRYYFLNQYGFQNNTGEVAGDLHIRLGYSF